MRFLCCKSYKVMEIKALEDVSHLRGGGGGGGQAGLTGGSGGSGGSQQPAPFLTSLLLRSGRVALMGWVFSSSSVCQMNLDVEFPNFEDITTASPGGPSL